MDQIERVFNAALNSLRRDRVSLRDPVELIEVLVPCGLRPVKPPFGAHGGGSVHGLRPLPLRLRPIRRDRPQLPPGPVRASTSGRNRVPFPARSAGFRGLRQPGEVECGAGKLPIFQHVGIFEPRHPKPTAASGLDEPSANSRFVEPQVINRRGRFGGSHAGVDSRWAHCRRRR